MTAQSLRVAAPSLSQRLPRTAATAPPPAAASPAVVVAAVIAAGAADCAATSAAPMRLAPRLLGARAHQVVLAQVFGAGTDVGKTLLSAALCRTAGRRGWRVGYLKPLQTGCCDGSGSDARYDAAAAAAAVMVPAALARVAASCGRWSSRDGSSTNG